MVNQQRVPMSLESSNLSVLQRERDEAIARLNAQDEKIDEMELYIRELQYELSALKDRIATGHHIPTLAQIREVVAAEIRSAL